VVAVAPPYWLSVTWAAVTVVGCGVWGCHQRMLYVHALEQLMASDATHNSAWAFATGMFYNTFAFNQPLGAWNTSRVMNFECETSTTLDHCERDH
jgi:hypothetical protein